MNINLSEEKRKGKKKNTASYFPRLQFHEGSKLIHEIQNIQKPRVSLEDHVAGGQEKRARIRTIVHRLDSPFSNRSRRCFRKVFDVRDPSRIDYRDLKGE